ncbi:LPXTG cell wall anchor domain-containing protein [Roseivirga seohaensis]|uniref:LPXTG cell wall anchor domain-containing protein n=1 Tax=Roseivirga seohaensis TaxID=1914963 RepID=UPI003BAD9854
MLYTFIENPSSHFDVVEYTPIVYQKSIYKANDPDETDFLSENPNLIWGILIGVMVLAFAFYAFLKKKKN